MPSFFSKFKGNGPSKVKKGQQQALLNDAPPKPQWEDAWLRKTVEPEEVVELLSGCTLELKSRALDMPFLLLPFRPTSDPSAARTFIRNFFERSLRNQPLRGEDLAQELRLTEPMVLCSVVKWCWSRIPAGVVGWEAYELFKVGETDSNMARDAFKTFIPLSVDSDARTKIIFDFFDLLSGVAAHSKTNGMGGGKLSRLAGWWAFEHADDGTGFEGGYKRWAAAADATSHLFFAYLRSLSPGSVKGLNGISTLPMSLQKLVQETDYPPVATLQTKSMKVVMIVDSVSPTPFALLRRANHFQYRDDDRALQEFAEYEDPVKALTDECKRVMKSISSANQSHVSTQKDSTGLTDASWSRFEDIGFSGAFDEEEEDEDSNFGKKKRKPQGLNRTPRSNVGMGRPTTPSWADFLSSGFVDEAGNGPAPLLLPPDKILPPIDTRGRSSQSHRPRMDNLEPGELASITRINLDDAFWWVWISSLAGEESSERKAAFGRCALAETVIRGGRWLVMEEKVKGAAPAAEEGAYVAEKKNFWTRSRKDKGPTRRKSTGKYALEQNGTLRPQFPSMGASKTSIGPDQHARIQAAAAQLQKNQREREAEQFNTRRGREADQDSMKTNSVMTLGTVFMNDASPALKWASAYDKDAIREAYLNNSGTGRGLEAVANGHKSEDTLKPASTQRAGSVHKDLPAAPSSSKPVVPVKESAPLPPSVNTYRQEDAYLSEKAAEVALPQESHPVERKAVPVSTPQVRPSIEQSSSPESQLKYNKLKKKDSSAGNGFKKLFGRKNRQSVLPETMPPSVSANGQNGDTGNATFGKRFSSFRKNSMRKRDSMIAATPTTTPGTPTKRISEDQKTPVKSVQSPHQQYDRSYDPSVRESMDTADEQEAHQAFSSFDQGPMEDVPAFVPEETPRQSIDEAIPPPIEKQRTPVSEERVETPKAREPEKLELSKTPSPPAVQDRWAQIRKNAADRAAAKEKAQAALGKENVNGGVETKERPSEEDGETSGEETIESRVARIKARVAELTGNMEGNGAPAAPVATNGTNGRAPRRP